MRECEQMPGLSVLQHGEMVAQRYEDLLGDRSMEWRLPDWVDAPEILDHLPSLSLMRRYHLFHDCGKPLCRTTNGRFPNHAAVSKQAWLAAGGDAEVGELIGMDMDAHLLKGDGVAEFASRPQAPALLLTALAEVHANASMFGGIQSTSFKIKWKHIDKRGRQVLTAM